MNLFVICYCILRPESIRFRRCIILFGMTLLMSLSYNIFTDVSFIEYSYPQKAQNGIRVSLSTLDKHKDKLISKRQEERENFKEIGANQKGNNTSEGNEELAPEPSAETAKSWRFKIADRSKNSTGLAFHKFDQTDNNSTKSNNFKPETIANTGKLKESIGQASIEPQVSGRNARIRTFRINDSIFISRESAKMQTHVHNKQFSGASSTKAVAGRRKVQQNLTGLNVHLWFSLCAKSMSVLCNHPSFPLFPDLREHLLGKLDLNRKEQDFAQRIFGLVSPPESGQYRLENVIAKTGFKLVNPD